jgi:ribosome modulation factor
MFSKSLAKLKREGREAYTPDLPAESECPYYPGSTQEHGWLLGWREAEVTAKKEGAKKDRADREWAVRMEGCPWFGDASCVATRGACCRENCAPWFFRGGV